MTRFRPPVWSGNSSEETAFINNKNRLTAYAASLSLSKKFRRICRFCGKPIQIHVPPGRVPGGTYFSGCKCGICSPMANKLCARQTAKICRKSPKGFFDSFRLAAYAASLKTDSMLHGRTGILQQQGNQQAHKNRAEAGYQPETPSAGHLAGDCQPGNG